MIKIDVISIGKSKEPWLEEALALYVKRLSGQIKLTFTLVKDDSALLKRVDGVRGVLALDEKGELMTSTRFSSVLFKTVQDHGARAAFVIGGADGLPKEIRERYPLISLSRLTFTHQMARLILAEQIYRAMEIKRGSKYHRDG